MDGAQTTLEVLAGVVSPAAGASPCIPVDQLRMFYSVLACGIVVYDQSGAVTFANKAAERALGRGLDWLRGRKHDDLGLRTVDAGGAALPRSAHPVTVAGGTLTQPARDAQRGPLLRACPLCDL